MRLLINLLVAIAIAVIVGLGSAWLVLDRERIFGAVRRGAWTAWPELGSPNADPYSRAELARSGALPLGNGEGIAFVADTDDSGSALTARCSYIVSGQTPAARLWTLTVSDREGNFLRDAGPSKRLSRARNPPPRRWKLCDRRFRRASRATGCRLQEVFRSVSLYGFTIPH